MFCHRMLTDAKFQQEVSDQFPAYMHRQRVTHYVQASEPDKLHVHWAGMHPRTCLRTFFLSNEMLHVCSKLFA